MFGPYYYEDDDTYNTFRVLGTANGYDSVQYSMIQVIVDADQAAADKRADSILTAASKRGADFSAIAANYNQTATESWLASDSYETASITGDNAAFINKINSLKKGEVGMVQVTGANLIIKVLDTKTPLKKYDIAIIKRPAEFSEETSNAAYDKLSQFIASNSTIEELQQNVDDTDFRLLYNPGIENYNYNIGGVGRSHEALRWAFDAEEGEISRIFEVGSNNDHLLVVAVSKIHPRGYRSIEDAAQVLSLKALNNKKFDVLKNKMAEILDSLMQPESTLRADTAYYMNNDKLWRLRHNVHAENIDNEEFDTQELYINNLTNRMYSDSLIRIKQDRQIIVGHGFESNNHLTEYSIRKTEGVFPVTETE